jgi:uncharacterized protein
MNADQIPVGKFVWHDLMTTDVDRAVAFYTALLPWTLENADMGEMGTYRMILAAGAGQGGFMPLDPAHGMPSHWVGYVAVEDVESAVEAALRNGGQAPVPGEDIPKIGRFAVVLDAQGAVSSPFRPIGPEAKEREPGARPAVGTFCWDELLALDTAGEGAFHTAVFGWSVEDMPMGEMGTYHVFKRGDRNAAGMLAKPADSPGPSLWMPYVEVDDIDVTAARVPELGGQVFVKPMDIPGVGRFAVIGDPTGATFGLLRSGE